MTLSPPSFTRLMPYSEFPSLSNNQTQPSQSTWAASGSRNLGPAANMRLQQQSTLSSQQQLSAQQQTQQQQDDLFSSSSQLPSTQGGFRFGSQNAVGQSSQSDTKCWLRCSNKRFGLRFCQSTSAKSEQWTSQCTIWEQPSVLRKSCCISSELVR
jgi:hypothetical protein